MCAVCICALSILDAKALAGPPDGPFVPAKDPVQLQARLGKILSDSGVPGMAAVIADRDGIVWTAGVGLADVGARTPATPDTLFRVASISKTFVALAVLRLREEGRLDLDAPVKSLVPDVAFRNKWEATDPVRVVHLLGAAALRLAVRREAQRRPGCGGDLGVRGVQRGLTGGRAARVEAPQDDESVRLPS